MATKYPGVAHSIQIHEVRQGTNSRLHFSFNINSNGREIPVEMNGKWGKTLHGKISEGDQVEVEGKMKSYGIEAKKIRNITTGFEVKF